MRDIIVTSSVLIAFVLLIRYLAKGRLNPLLQYALWLPVVLRLVIPVPLWSSSFSVLNLLPNQSVEKAADRTDLGNENAVVRDIVENTDETGIENGMEDSDETDALNGVGNLTDTDIMNRTGTENGTKNQAWSDLSGSTKSAADASFVNGAGNSTDTGIMNNTGNPNGVGAASKTGNPKGVGIGARLLSDADSLLRLIWAAGVLLIGGYMLFYQIKWKRYLYANRKPLKGWETYRGTLSVYTVRGLPSPCLSGRCVYLTKEMARDEKQLEHILAHEYCHYRHLDSLWVIVRCVLTVCYWFHPLVWAAAWASKQDSELACDASAIRLLGEKERLDYGKTLLRLIIGDDCDRSRIGIASTMSGGEKGIRERILRIAGKPKHVAVTAGIVLVLAAVAVAVTFSGAKEERLDILQEQQDELQQQEALSEQDLQQEGTKEQELTKQQEEDLQRLEQEFTTEVEELKKQEAEEEAARHAAQEDEKAAREAAERESAILERLASYDASIEETGSRAGVFAVRDSLNLSDYVQAYYEEGEAALEEGMYLLETYKGPDSSDIKVYGMYSKEYGCEGIKILIGDDVNDFDEEWLISGFHGMEESIRLYESAEDKMPRTFAYKTVVVNNSDQEIWNLYLCDRYDTGTIELCAVRPEEFLEEINERLRVEINAKDCTIDLYDKEKLIDTIPIDASAEAMASIREVAAESVSWDLGNNENEIRMLTVIGLKVDGTDDIWYRGLPVLCFPVTCGDFGEREIQFGQASVETELVSQKGRHEEESLDQFLEAAGTGVLSSAFKADDGLGHHDLEILYSNPCPSYTRISDTFGTRENPVTGEKKLHNGIDLAAQEGADIVAAAEGTVYQTGFDAVYGNYVVLYHGQSGEFTYYAACKDVLVKEGGSVTAGQKIATVGSTGSSTGPHLHFALSRNGEYIEPVFEQG